MITPNYGVIMVIKLGGHKDYIIIPTSESSVTCFEFNL